VCFDAPTAVPRPSRVGARTRRLRIGVHRTPGLDMPLESPDQPTPITQPAKVGNLPAAPGTECGWPASLQNKEFKLGAHKVGNRPYHVEKGTSGLMAPGNIVGFQGTTPPRICTLSRHAPPPSMNFGGGAPPTSGRPPPSRTGPLARKQLLGQRVGFKASIAARRLAILAKFPPREISLRSTPPLWGKQGAFFLHNHQSTTHTGGG